MNWLAAAGSRLLIAVRVKEHAGQHSELSFDGIDPAIGGFFTDRELSVFVDWQGRNWDLLINLDVMPERARNGYVCTLCGAEARTIFPDLDALWRDHLFEPFLQWVNGKLTAADTIGLYGSPSGGWTHAELLSGRDARRPEPEISVPLRGSHDK